MPLKDDFSNLRQRLGDFAARFEEKARSHEEEGSHHDESSRRKSVYSTLRDLFTKDVTREGLRDLIHRDTQDTWNYFTREIDFEALKPLPWYQRYPHALGRIFLTLAYRLSPPRRIAFVVAFLAIFLGAIELLNFRGPQRGSDVAVIGPGNPMVGWWLIAIAILVLLLLMELRDKLDLKSELEIAREIQLGLVPSKPFNRDHITIHCQMRTANTVGGDYYDIIELGENQIGVVIGDVSGKGMPAALLMALLQGSLRTLITAGLRGSELITKLNEYLCANIPPNSLVTFFYGELNTLSGEFCFINAGHNAPFHIRRDPTFDRLSSTTIPLGLNKETPFESRGMRLEPGERLLLFTDGISEAFNAEELEYSEARIEGFLRAHINLSREQLLQGLMSDVLAFCQNVRQNDDMTLMVVERQA